MVGAPGIGHREEMDDLPDQDVARDFYAKYEPKEVLGRYSTFYWLSFTINSNIFIISLLLLLCFDSTFIALCVY